MGQEYFGKNIHKRTKHWILYWLIANIVLVTIAAGYIFESQADLQDQIIPAMLVLPTKPPITATAQPTPSSTNLPSIPAADLIGTTSTPQPATFPLPTETPSATPLNHVLIGYSVAGRPLEVVQLGDGPIHRMIVAGIHGGNEYNTIQLVQKLIRYLNERPQKIPEDVTLYILPALNPDGAARAHNIYGRANENGVDLNRNFPVSWQAAWDQSRCWHYLQLNGGAHPASEPESIALMGFLLSHQVDAMISYHSAALGIFPGGDPPDPVSQSLAEAISTVSDYPYPPINIGCEMTGSLADWAVSQNIAALDIELTNHTDLDFKQNLAVLSTFLKWRR